MLHTLSFALLAIVSCNVADPKEVDYSPTFDLTDKRVFELLASLQSEAFSGVNFHLRYAERFNDSTGIVEVSINSQLPMKGLDSARLFSLMAAMYLFTARDVK